jgi:hypothetical protein
VEGGRVAEQAASGSGRTVLEVAAAASDRALAHALARGAHVHRVQPRADGIVVIEVDEP